MRGPEFLPLYAAMNTWQRAPEIRLGRPAAGLPAARHSRRGGNHFFL
jgi:hypothetical protein